jgi:hypothetical protein
LEQQAEEDCFKECSAAEEEADCSWGTWATVAAEARLGAGGPKGPGSWRGRQGSQRGDIGNSNSSRTAARTGGGALEAPTRQNGWITLGTAAAAAARLRGPPSRRGRHRLQLRIIGTNSSSSSNSTARGGVRRGLDGGVHCTEAA